MYVLKLGNQSSPFCFFSGNGHCEIVWDGGTHGIGFGKKNLGNKKVLLLVLGVRRVDTPPK